MYLFFYCQRAKENIENMKLLKYYTQSFKNVLQNRYLVLCIFRYFTQKHDENTQAITFFSAVLGSVLS